MKISNKKAFIIGAVFCTAYLISYAMRKLLGQARTDIIYSGVFTCLQMDSYQSFYMVFYALGQLINGVIGDYLPPRKMIFGGFVLSGIAVIAFAASDIYAVSLISFMLLGYGMSMLRGPMMRLIAQNASPKAARLICVFFSFTTYFSTFIAAIIVMVFKWRQAFLFAGLLLFAVAGLVWLYIRHMEKSGGFKPLPGQSAQCASSPTRLTFAEFKKIFALPDFMFYFFVSGLTETAATTIGYWLPSFIEGRLGQTAEFAGFATSVISILTALCPFAALLLFTLFKGKIRPIIFGLFAVAAMAFCVLLFSRFIWLSLISIALALVLFGLMSSFMWSIYIPGLGKTGKVSGANGVLDCFGYLFASGTNALFSLIAGSRQSPNWSSLIIAWICVAVAGFLLTFIKKGRPAPQQG